MAGMKKLKNWLGFTWFDRRNWWVITPRWVVGCDKWGIYATRKPWPWGRFGVPARLNGNKRLLKF